MEKIRGVFSRIYKFLKRHKWSALLVFLALLVAGFFIWDIFSAKTDFNIEYFKPGLKKETKVRAPISGRMVTEEQAKRKPIAVVIENSPEARPQSGLNKASLVFETFAEGGITRFLVIFQEEDVAEIGPVRSARNYFVEWAKSYDAIFTHVGGSSDAIALISRLRVLDLNQFHFGSYFWRDRNRAAPHNVYTTTDKIRAAAKTKNYANTDDNIPSFNFKDDPKPEERPATSGFTVNFNAGFAVTYTYNPTENNYLRSMRGIAQTDRNSKEQIKAKNVIVCFSDFSYGKTSTGEQSTKIRTTGIGNAVFYIDGARTAGTWKRPSDSAITRFYDDNGNEIKLNAGTTWVEFAPVGTLVK